MTADTRQQLADIANNAVLVLLARLASVVGVPLGVAMLAWFATEMLALRVAVTRLETQITFSVLPVASEQKARLDKVEQQQAADRAADRATDNQVLGRLSVIETEVRNLRQSAPGRSGFVRDNPFDRGGSN